MAAWHAAGRPPIGEVLQYAVSDDGVAKITVHGCTLDALFRPRSTEADGQIRSPAAFVTIGARVTAVNLDLYRLLIKLGATEVDAATAATADETRLATQADVALLRGDLRREMADLRSDLLKWGVGLLFTGLTMQTALVIFALTRLAHS